MWGYDSVIKQQQNRFLESFACFRVQRITQIPEEKKIFIQRFSIWDSMKVGFFFIFQITATINRSNFSSRFSLLAMRGFRP